MHRDVAGEGDVFRTPVYKRANVVGWDGVRRGGASEGYIVVSFDNIGARFCGGSSIHHDQLEIGCRIAVGTGDRGNPNIVSPRAFIGCDHRQCTSGWTDRRTLDDNNSAADVGRSHANYVKSPAAILVERAHGGSQKAILAKAAKLTIVVSQASDQHRLCYTTCRQNISGYGPLVSDANKCGS